MIIEFLAWLWEYRLELLVVALVLFYGKSFYTTYIFNPLAGGNGKVQMDEIAKAILLVMIVKASQREGKSVEQVYPDIYWIMLFASVCAIAAIKPGFAAFKKVKDGLSENKS
jgi:hypothetical protein